MVSPATSTQKSVNTEMNIMNGVNSLKYRHGIIPTTTANTIPIKMVPACLKMGEKKLLLLNVRVLEALNTSTMLIMQSIKNTIQMTLSPPKSFPINFFFDI